MNNLDRFQIQINKKNYIEATRVAIENGLGKSSRSGAWAWSDEAVKAAAMAGIQLNVGNLSWPDFDSMLKQLPSG